jgi:putative acetyltransferase
MHPPVLVRPEALVEKAAIGELVTNVFQGDLEARLIERLRDEEQILASLVAIADQRLVGNVVFSHLLIPTEGRSIEAAALAPLAVHPEYQRLGIGSALVNEGLRICEKFGKEAVIVVGDPRYYARFGFSPGTVTGIASKYSGPAFMGLELAPNALRDVRGRAIYPSAFDDLD